MFGRTKKNVIWLTFFDGVGNITSKFPMTDLKVPEDIVIEKSIEFFNDPTPCVIHRGAVLSRLMMELEDALDIGAVTPLISLPPEIRRYLSEYTNAQWVCITLEGKE